MIETTRLQERIKIIRGYNILIFVNKRERGGTGVKGQNVALDDYVKMPKHFRGIAIINADSICMGMARHAPTGCQKPIANTLSYGYKKKQPGSNASRPNLFRPSNYRTHCQ